MRTRLAVGQIVRDPSVALRLRIGIVIGLLTRRRCVCRWRDVAAHWGPPIVVSESKLEPVADPTALPLTALPLTEAKHLVAAAFERNYLSSTMERARGAVAEAARLAGVDRPNFRRLLQRHGLHKATHNKAQKRRRSSPSARGRSK